MRKNSMLSLGFLTLVLLMACVVFHSEVIDVSNLSPKDAQVVQEGAEFLASIRADASHIHHGSANLLDGLGVHNLNTTRSYAAIQQAIDADETLDGHVIIVDSGIYYENVFVNKALSLLGQDRSSTVIEGSGETVFHVKSDNVEISAFTIRNGTFGLWFDHAENAKIINNTLSDGEYGIRLYYSNNAQIIGNHVSNYRYFGIELDSSGNCLLRDNSMAGNMYNFGVDGDLLSDFTNDIDDSNTVNGKRMRYLINQRGRVVNRQTFEDYGYIGFVNSTDILVENLDVQNNKQGLLLAFVADSSIISVSAVANWNGIYVAHSRNVSVSQCNANHNFDYGIKFRNSSDSSVVQNNVDSNGWAGLGLFRSPDSFVDKNEANFNFYNLHLVSTNNSLIARNNASGLVSGESRGYSIAIYYSHNNLIYHNSFSTALLFVESRNGLLFPPKNKWDNGFEGNYWLSYDGLDENLDGIGDSACNVGEDDVDNYPLMGRFQDYTVSLEGRVYNVATICNLTIQNFDFSSSERKLRLTFGDRNGTLGFCRIAIPNSLIHDIGYGNLSFDFSGLLPTLARNWTDGASQYWYFSCNHVADGGAKTFDQWPVIIAFGFSVLLISAGLVLFMVFKKRRASSKV